MLIPAARKVGGAGSLYVSPRHAAQLADTPDFPAEHAPLASAQRDELAEIRRRDDVRWAFVSPAAEFVADGPRTGADAHVRERISVVRK